MYNGILHLIHSSVHGHLGCLCVLVTVNSAAMNIGVHVSFYSFLWITGEGTGNSLQYSCLENSMDRGAWQTTVHGVAESDMTERLSLSLDICPGVGLLDGMVILVLVF